MIFTLKTKKGIATTTGDVVRKKLKSENICLDDLDKEDADFLKKKYKLKINPLKVTK